MSADRIPPSGLHPRLISSLLDNLEQNAEFRAMFQESPENALRSLGYTDPWDCMSLKSGLASPEEIKKQRAKLEDALSGIQGMTCPLEAQATAGL
jgi:putative modified peptide